MGDLVVELGEDILCKSRRQRKNDECQQIARQGRQDPTTTAQRKRVPLGRKASREKSMLTRVDGGLAQITDSRGLDDVGDLEPLDSLVLESA